MEQIDSLFDRLDDWRHFTGYQLERRADIFFSFYLAEALGKAICNEVKETLIPEFPLPIDGKANGRTNRADYLALSVDGEDLILVELKTDMKSGNRKQDEYLRKAQAGGAERLLQNVICGFRYASDIGKHYCMLEELAKLGLIKIPQEFQELMEVKPRYDAKNKSLTIRICEKPPSRIHVIYVQPTCKDDSPPGTICFGALAEIVEKKSDPVSQRFAKSLRTWAEVKPGDDTKAQNPSTLPLCPLRAFA